jgi:hypothetical protein
LGWYPLYVEGKHGNKKFHKALQDLLASGAICPNNLRLEHTGTTIWERPKGDSATELLVTENAETLTAEEPLEELGKEEVEHVLEDISVAPLPPGWMKRMSIYSV